MSIDDRCGPNPTYLESRPHNSLGALVLICWLLSCLFGLFADPMSSSLPKQELMIENNTFSSITAAQYNAKVLVARELEAEWEGLPVSNKMLAYIKRITPLLTWTNICSASGVSLSLFMATCIEERRHKYIYSDAKESIASLSSLLRPLWSFNKLDAIAALKGVMGMSSSDVITLNVFGLLQFSSLALFFVWVPYRHGLKAAFIVTLLISMIASFSTQMLFRQSWSVAVENLYTLYGTIVGILAAIFGLILLWRWSQAKVLPNLQILKNDVRKFLYVPPRPDYDVERWNALVKFDDEISAAADQLRPYGEGLVSELAKAFFALKEDRKYLPSIVLRLKAEVAQRQKLIKADEKAGEPVGTSSSSA